MLMLLGMPSSSSDPAVPATARWVTLAAVVITLFGFSQMAGYLIGSAGLRGLGAVSVVAPFPKVFSDVDGLETFASVFHFEGTDENGQPVVIPLTAERYAQLAGPYNRRNVYGAALSYGPRLPESLWQAVFCFGLGEGGPLRQELGVDQWTGPMRVHIRTQTRGRNDQWLLDGPCWPVVAAPEKKVGNP